MLKYVNIFNKDTVFLRNPKFSLVYIFHKSIGIQFKEILIFHYAAIVAMPWFQDLSLSRGMKWYLTTSWIKPLYVHFYYSILVANVAEGKELSQ